MPPTSRAVIIRKSSIILVSFIVLCTLIGCGRKKGGAEVPTLTLFYNAEEQPTEKSAISQLLQSQLRDHGIPVKLDPVSNSIFNDRLGKCDFQSTLSLWYLDYNDPEGFLTDFYSKAGFRMAKYSNPEYDKEYLAGLLAPTEAEKSSHYRSAQAIVLHDLPWIPLYSNDELFFLTKGTDGFRSNSFQYYDYRRVTKSPLRVSTDVEVQTFDPAQAYDLASKHVVTQSYEGVVAMDDSNRIVPSLATSWKFSDRNDELTFNLRPGIRFHHPAGVATISTTLSADDVKFTFERMLKSNSPYTYIFDYVQGVDDFKAGKASQVSGFKVVSALTFKIVLTRPFPTMLPWLLAPAAYIVPRGLPDKYDFTKGSVGTGPFILLSFDGVTAAFTANPDYYLRDSDGSRLPRSKSLTLRIIKDSNTLVTAFRQGSIDILNLPLALYPEFLTATGEPKPEWTAYEFRSVHLMNLKFLCFNMLASPWGTSQELRNQVASAIDRGEIVKQVFRGRARASTTIVPPEMIRP